MAFKLIESAHTRWRAVNAPHRVALVRAVAKFHNGKLVERPDDTIHRFQALLARVEYHRWPRALPARPGGAWFAARARLGSECRRPGRNLQSRCGRARAWCRGRRVGCGSGCCRPRASSAGRGRRRARCTRHMFVRSSGTRGTTGRSCEHGQAWSQVSSAAVFSLHVGHPPSRSAGRRLGASARRSNSSRASGRGRSADCRSPRSWDQVEPVLATVMGPPELPVMGPLSARLPGWSGPAVCDRFRSIGLEVAGGVPGGSCARGTRGSTTLGW
jgi:hypothetical protein